MSEGRLGPAGGEGPFAADPLDRSAVAAVGLITLFVVALATAQLTAAKVIALPLPFALPVVGPEITLLGAPRSRTRSRSSRPTATPSCTAAAPRRWSSTSPSSRTSSCSRSSGPPSPRPDRPRDRGRLRHRARPRGQRRRREPARVRREPELGRGRLPRDPRPHRPRHAVAAQHRVDRQQSGHRHRDLRRRRVLRRPSCSAPGTRSRRASSLLALGLGQYLLKLAIAVLDTPIVYLVVGAVRE